MAHNLPVEIPQPSKQILSSGASEFTYQVFISCNNHQRISIALPTLAKEISGRTVYSLNVLVPIKWYKCLPLHKNLDVPSGITPLPWVPLSIRVFKLNLSHKTSIYLILLHKFVFELKQNLHSLH